MDKKCKCCGKKLTGAFGATWYCTKCTRYIRELREEKNNLKKCLKRLKESNAKLREELKKYLKEKKVDICTCGHTKGNHYGVGKGFCKLGGCSCGKFEEKK